MITQEQYIEDCVKKHKGYFKYPNTIYEGGDKNVKIECPVHGEIEVNAGNHRRGAGCRLCSYEKRADSDRKGKEKFVEDAKKVHNNPLLSYDNFIYVNNKTHGISEGQTLMEANVSR